MDTLNLSCFNVSLENQEIIAKYLRIKSWQLVASNQSGHLGGPSSSVELMTALYFGGFLNLDLFNNSNINRDKVMVRGHLCPLRYSIFYILGWIQDNELNTYRQIGSRLQGHEKMGTICGIDITPSGALGLILSYGIASAINARIEKFNYKSFVFLGDGEEQEGNISEAARHAACLKLNSLICIMDKNGKQLSRPTKDVDNSDLTKVWEGYGWEVFEIKNGHDLKEINSIYKKVLKSSTNKPKMIIANTIKGMGLPGAIDYSNGYHTINSFGADSLIEFLKTLEIPSIKSVKEMVFETQVNLTNSYDNHAASGKNEKLDFAMDTHISDFIEEELALFFRRCSDLMKKDYPLYVMTADLIMMEEVIGYGFCNQAKYIDVGIREQHLIALAHGLSISNPQARIVIKMHDSFLYRAADQIQAINIGESRVIILGDYGGLSGCYNGDTHQSVGQMGTVLTMSNAIVFEPSDAIDFWKVINYSLINNPGLVYIRLYSKKSPILQRVDNNDWYYVTCKSKKKPKIILVSSGLTANDTFLAGKQLNSEGIPTKVINVINLNSIRTKNFVELFESNAKVLTIYNGNPFILQSLVSTTLLQFSKKQNLQVFGHGFVNGESGTMDDLKKLFCLDSAGIVEKVKSLL